MTVPATQSGLANDAFGTKALIQSESETYDADGEWLTQLADRGRQDGGET